MVTRRVRLIGYALLEVAVGLVVLSGVDSSYRACCWKCGMFLVRTTLFDLPLPHTSTEPAAGVDVIRSAYPGPCFHDWKPVVENRHACGNVDVFGPWQAAATAERIGLLESARAVDPQGAADLARCLLRQGAPSNWDALLQERGPEDSAPKPFTSADEFRSWVSRFK